MSIRITPACAGTTHGCKRHNDGNGDHPRVCGNHQCTICHVLTSLGSPPRVREPPG